MKGLTKELRIKLIASLERVLEERRISLIEVLSIPDLCSKFTIAAHYSAYEKADHLLSAAMEEELEQSSEDT